MTHRYGILRRFRFNLPQRIAAALLALFLAQGLWLIGCLEATVPLPWGPLLARLAFLAAGCLLGGCLWWVTRRLYGNLGGYTALGFFCLSPTIPRACLAADPTVLAALAIYGGIYTSIGVAHAMQGPRRKWRPRILLLTAAFTLAALAQTAALAVSALLGLALMLWVAEGRRRTVLPVALVAVGGALVLKAVVSLVWPGGLSALHCLAVGTPDALSGTTWGLSLALANAGIALAALAAVTLYLSTCRSRYFGNTAPLLCALTLYFLAWMGIAGISGLWALPFLLTFVGGVAADAYEGPRGRLAKCAVGVLLLVQAAGCAASLAGPR